jgi:competence protein ComEA
VRRIFLFITAALAAGVPRSYSAEPLTKLAGCTLVPADWADGDSFPVKTGDGKVLTLRLYGADCLEWHVTDETDARRLREQRRYFGISQLDSDPKQSIERAKDFGRMAGERVAVLLKQPFTVHTTFTGARGDGRHPRIYGFVTLANGRDLAGVLVAEGLARAFGVNHETPDGRSGDEYRQALQDLELQAAKRGRGVWAHTDWETLPTERRAQRAEEEDAKMATGSAKASFNGTLDPNTAARDELMKLPGVGEAMANRIIEHRPFTSIADLRRVPGVGPKTLEKLRPHLKIGRAKPRGG